MNYIQFETDRCELDIPMACACCMGEPEEPIEITAVAQGMVTKTYTVFSIPYCRACAGHVRGHERGWMAGALVATAVVAALFFVQPKSFDHLSGGEIGIACAIFVVATWLVRTRVAPLLAQNGPRCANDAGAVGVRTGGFTGSTYVFVCYNEEWGQRFRDANS